MTCRESKLSSATITLARCSGLRDVQLLSINHDLMEEAHSLEGQGTPETWNAVIDSYIAQIQDGSLVVPNRAANPISRLEAARTEQPSAERIYAALHVISRAQTSANSHNNYILNSARILGISEESAARSWNEHCEDAERNSALKASEDFINDWTSVQGRNNFIRDRRSLYAYEQLESRKKEMLQNGERELIALRHYEITSEAGYVRFSVSPNGEYAELVQRREVSTGEYRDVLTAYRLSDLEELNPDLKDYLVNYDETSTWDDANAASLLWVAYREQSEIDNARWRSRCATCGQFVSLSAHACPVTGSAEAISEDIARITTGTTPPRFTTLPLLNTHYLVNDGMLVNMPDLNNLIAQGESEGDVRFEAAARIDSYLVEGVLHMEHDTDEDSFWVGAPTRIDRRMRCTCIDYQNSHSCPHVDEVVEYINSVVNREVSPEIREFQNGEVLSAIAVENAASEIAIEEANSSYPTLKKSFAENPELFQDMYKEARLARKRWEEGEGEFPVPYVKENALMGFGTRESGRGFGIEIEYAFPNDMPYDEVRQASFRIGEELYNLGLTSEMRQGGYGASHGWYRDYHSRGWSYESDFSTGGSDGQQGGEIVSPVMYDEPDTWENIEKVCEILTRNGAFASKGSGNHVHVGLTEYDHRVANHNRLLNTYARNEDLIYRLSVNPDRGRHRGFGYCQPNSLASTPYARISAASAGNNSHGTAINMQSVSGRDSDHIEFRTYDSTLNPSIIQTQIAMSVLMVEGALRGNSNPAPAEGRVPLGHRLGLNPRRRVLTGAAWDETTSPVREFIDELIPQHSEDVKNNHLIRQVVSLFAMTKWQTQASRRLADLPQDS
jgi:rRNA maturation endonuclease Nob1